jgi:putative endonuclease
MAEHNELGKSGEAIAAGFLKNKGYSVLEINWRKGPLEIDLIAKTGNILVIVEVKTRSSNYFGEPEEFVTRAKQKTLIRAANLYILENDIELEARFDIISVLISGEQHRVHHIEDAFYPTI